MQQLLIISFETFVLPRYLLLILTPLIKSWAKVFDRKLSQTVLLFSPSFLSQPHISRLLHKTKLVQMRSFMLAGYLYLRVDTKCIVEYLVSLHAMISPTSKKKHWCIIKNLGNLIIKLRLYFKAPAWP